MIEVSFRNMRTFTRDVTQACVQCEKTLEREVYIYAPSEMQPRHGKVLEVVRHLYGIQESGRH